MNSGFVKKQIRIRNYLNRHHQKQMESKLCIGMCTYDDFDGVYFTIQAIRLYHPEILDRVEFLVVDNNPDGPDGKAVRNFGDHIPNFRYVGRTEKVGTSIRDVIFEETDCEYVLVMDCHVLVAAGAIHTLITLLDKWQRKPKPFLIHGPLLYDDGQHVATHFKPEWREGMWGTWETDDRAYDKQSAPFAIPMQGLGLFACRKKDWPGFNPRFRGFGGEEGYIHEKFRQAGGRVLCFPFLRWMHRFQRPDGVPYPNQWDDRIRNYLIGWEELRMSTELVREHFIAKVGEKVVDRILQEIEDETIP